MLDFLQVKMSEANRPSTMEPSLVDAAVAAQTDGSIRLKGLDQKTLAIVLIMEGREDWNTGGGSNPAMQLVAYYAKQLVFGHGFRVHALFFTDRVCCEPLTEWVHFADLRTAQPCYMEYLLRILGALAVCLDEICSDVRPLLEVKRGRPSGFSQPRSQKLQDGIPYMLLIDSLRVEQLSSDKAVYLCTSPANAAAAAAEDKFIAKLVSTPYPWQLHEELGPAGRLRDAADWDTLDVLAHESLAKLQSCLSDHAVHGDLNPPNIFVRLARDPSAADSQSRPVEVEFVDLAWGGKSGKGPAGSSAPHEQAPSSSTPDDGATVATNTAREVGREIGREIGWEMERQSINSESS
ncbi:hypothetical protein WJX72_005689 [[Myrmecia] bisecta]|uniref:Protein kinase domain-containing protein n=1 Tax=[Myrmecia] bisecta TaxID=41462 RepID=A0AAW1P5D5_9CHLO